ncbi:MAG: hypothetical protein ACI4PJ_01530 [Acutalibacteraceae bacterium]
MGKRLFATKTSALNDKITKVDCEGRYNSSVYEDILDKLNTAKDLHTLQLAAETFAKNLGITYTEAAGGDEVAESKLKSKLEQFYNSWAKDKTTQTTKKNYIKNFYHPETTETTETNITDVTITNSDEKTKDGGINFYFINDLRGHKTDIRMKGNCESHSKTLQKYVEETAEIWRKKKQKLKKEAQTQLKKIKKVCKTVGKYEDWFMNCGSDDYLNKLDAKKLAKLKIQAENKWKKYYAYLDNPDNNEYLTDNYNQTAYHTKAQENYKNIARKTAEKTAIN